MEKITLSFAALAAIIAMTIPQACAGTATTQCAKPTLTPLRREQCHNIRNGHDSDGDSGGLFALHARRFYTDWRSRQVTARK